MHALACVSPTLAPPLYPAPRLPIEIQCGRAPEQAHHALTLGAGGVGHARFQHERASSLLGAQWGLSDGMVLKLPLNGAMNHFREWQGPQGEKDRNGSPRRA